MLRVGLTGGLGSGKSTVAGYLRGLGAEVIEADALGRSFMEPGQQVFERIVERFGPEVLTAEGRLNRARLAQIAFGEGRVQELNAIVHPATIEAQKQWMGEVFARDPAAVAVIESALIFEVVRDALARGETGSPVALLRRRMDRVIVVTAPDEVKIARYAARVSATGDRSSSPQRETAAADARARLAFQIPDAEKAAQADYVLDNSGDTATLRAQVEAVWRQLQTESNNSPKNLSLK
ncbi:MAG TPA: dephospho-CoA kinase [Terracidiphilus sp.]|jgi:dephospho-CoA kinase|nr:dephospho-CoA kinase [Terracidiphilus sp.]